MNGGTWQDHYYLPGVIQCKEFASYIFYQLHGIDYIGPTKDKPGNYEINLSYPNKVGIRGTQAYLNDNTAKLRCPDLSADSRADEGGHSKRKDQGK